MDVLNPQRIVIGGLALRLGDAVLAPARQVMRREGLPQTAGACEVVPPNWTNGSATLRVCAWRWDWTRVRAADERREFPWFLSAFICVHRRL